MRVFIVMLAVVVLAACQEEKPPSEGEKAERELFLVRMNNPSPEEECEARRKVAEGYLRDENAKKYEDAKMYADTACLNAESKRLL